MNHRKVVYEAQMGEKRHPARKPERRSHIPRLKCIPENNITRNLKGIGHESVE
jgi:hypothetical protein